MSLFRLAIVLSLGIAVMPSDREQQERLYEQAATAAYWTATFCDRNVHTCDTAAGLWETFLKKAEFAGQLAYDVAQRTLSSGESTAYAPASFKPGEAGSAKGQGTLRPDDLRPSWRGATPRQGI